MEALPSVELFRSAAWYFRLDILPFAVIQLILQAWSWHRIVVLGASSNDKILTILVALIPLALALHLLVFLSTRWSLRWKCWIALDRCESVEKAEWALATPAKHGGKPGLVPLLRGEFLRKIHFEFQKRCYVPTANGWTALESVYIDKSLNEYATEEKGLRHDKINEYRTNWGPNQFNIPDPTFWELFEEHYLAPFFVFQVLCCILWSLDEYWLYSALTLFMLLVFEATLCAQRFRSIDQLRTVKRPPSPIYVYRGQSWRLVSTVELVVGDIASLSGNTFSIRSSDSQRRALRIPSTIKEVPCDCLVLRGSCVVNEAMLTGESVPQRKDAVLADLDTAISAKASLDFDRAHRRYVVFGGSDLLDAGDSSSENFKSVPTPPDHGAVVHVVRTGSETSKGKLVRTILYATERVVGSRDSFAFIAVLLGCALLASAYVLREGLRDPDRNRFKLCLHAVLVITSVVPPELPMELSLAVTNSLQALVKHSVYCTEPFRIAFAGAVDVCCFDKTGTLTRDQLEMCSVRSFELDLRESIQVAEYKQDAFTAFLSAKAPSAYRTLAACHSLVMLPSGELVGDSMEKAQFKTLNATIRARDKILLKGSKKDRTLRILQRFAFASELRRMSCVVQDDSSSALWLVCKGAPEVIRSLLKVVPDEYDDVWRSDASRGDRVLALAMRRLTDKSGGRVVRADAERDLELCGFVSFSSRLKFGTTRVVSQLLNSGHRCIVITGDGALTAVHVARLVGIAIHKRAAVLVPGDDGNCVWRDARSNEVLGEDDVIATSANLKASNFDLIVRGDGLAHLTDTTQVQTLCELACVFARVAPDQKEDIVAALNKTGHTTLMCGDGTNDVSALKRAHVGVSVVNSPNLEHRLEKEAAKVTPDQSEDEKHSRLATFEMDAVDADPTLVELGDASIASPFTSKRATIDCVLAIIRQGRCTLVNMIQVFKVLALMCLQSAYVLSSLYLNGIKQGDTQMTVLGLVTAAFFFLLSRAQPLDTLANRRPPRRVFDLKPALSIVLQFIIHLSALIATLRLSAPFRPGGDASSFQLSAKHVPDGPFSPNVVNTAVFLLSAAVQVNTFATNYQGHPFMQALSEHKPLAGALVISYVSLAIVAADAIPYLTTILQLVSAPTRSFKRDLLQILALDTTASWVLSFLLH